MKRTFDIKTNSDEMDEIISDLKNNILTPDNGSIIPMFKYGVRVITHNDEDASWVKTKYGDRLSNS